MFPEMIPSTASAFGLLADQTGTFDSFPEAASTFASEVDLLYWIITWVCILFFVPIAGCLFWFSYRYCKPKGEKAESRATHNTMIELAWSVLPSFLLIPMFWYGAESYLDQRTVPDGANELYVKAFKWGWTIDYGGGTFNPEMHLLVNEPTKLTMQSSDVIHSLYVPAFRAKKDIVPGRFNYMWFKPTKVSERVSAEKLADAKAWHDSDEGKAWKKTSGTPWNYDQFQFTPDGYRFYDLYCTEYCGTNHSQMQTVVVVHETLDDLNAWVKKYGIRQAGVSPVEYGETLYQQRGCAGCHSVDGSPRVGPSFKDLYGSQHGLVGGGSVTVDANYVQKSIIYPKADVYVGYPAVMPSYKGQLTQDDLFCIVEYLKSISANVEEPASGGELESATGQASQPKEETESEAETTQS